MMLVFIDFYYIVNLSVNGLINKNEMYIGRFGGRKRNLDYFKGNFLEFFEWVMIFYFSVMVCVYSFVFRFF